MTGTESDRPEWFRDAVVYTLDVKTFADSDGDGWGDVRGLIDRLDHVEGVGADCIWVRPFYPSPLRDNGYDVADYYTVDDRLGTLEGFVAFVEAAHDRGIRVITDLVLNHTSTEHEWFQRAREGPDSPYHDYYLWTSHVEEAYRTGNIFPEYEDGVWSYDEVAGKHYFHQFYSHQPDLNVANPAVQEEIFSVIEFWLERGVDGFRIDAAHPMILPKGHDATTLEDPQWLFKEMKRRARAIRDDAVLLAEADDEPEHLDYYFADGEGFDALFNFVGNSHLVYGIGVKDTWPIHRMFEVLPDPSDTVWWANFLRNHDEWNLLKLPWETLDHGREYFRRGEGREDSWIFGRGHRLRLADLFDGDHDRIALAHSLLLSLPGTPILLSGDEIGMGADLSLPERAAVRTPFQWAAERNGGFSTAAAEDLVFPVNDDPTFGYERLNVADQREAPDSLLNRVSAAIDARKRCPEIREGEFEILQSGHREVFTHRYQHDEAVLLLAHNTADEPRRVVVEFDSSAETTEHVHGPGGYHVQDGGVTLFLDDCEYVWLRGDRSAWE